MVPVLAECVDAARCHVITKLPWYFGAAIAVVWVALIVVIAALIWRRRAARRPPSNRSVHDGWELPPARDG